MTDQETVQQNRAEWIDALESGEYIQGRVSLYSKDTESFCCLGVACAVGGRWNISDSKEDYKFVRDFLGIGQIDTERYWFMNDHASMTFEQIAAVARKEFGI